METVKGKLFQEISTKRVLSICYQADENYYDLIRNAQRQGFRQIIITSDIMLGLCEHFLLEKNIEILSFDFLVEDDELDETIKSMLSSLYQNKAYWSVLRRYMEFLQKEDSIDIKSTLFMEKPSGEHCSLSVNGIFTASRQYYKKISDFLSEYIARCLG